MKKEKKIRHPNDIEMTFFKNLNSETKLEWIFEKLQEIEYRLLKRK